MTLAACPVSVTEGAELVARQRKSTEVTVLKGRVKAGSWNVARMFPRPPPTGTLPKMHT